MKKNKALSKIQRFRSELGMFLSEYNDFRDIEEESENLSFEEKKIFSKLCWLNEKLEDLEGDIKYYSKKSTQGKLYKQDDGRYAINDSNYFTCGSPIEMFLYDSWQDEKVWCEGRVEGRFENGESIYYFLNKDGDNKDLEEGDLVRIRD